MLISVRMSPRYEVPSLLTAMGLGERLEAKAFLCCPDRPPSSRLSDPDLSLLLPTRSATFHSQTQHCFRHSEGQYVGKKS